MNMERSESPFFLDAKYVDVITSQRDGLVVGYRLQGGRPGPKLLVAGFSPCADIIYDRLLNLPTLPWLRGSLSMLMLDASDITDLSVAEMFGPDAQVDETLFLPFVAAEPDDMTDQVRDGYRSVLRLCERLGMIDGRGVYPRRKCALRLN